MFPNQLLNIKPIEPEVKIPLWANAVEFAQNHPDANYMPAVADDAEEDTYMTLQGTRAGMYVPTPFVADLVLNDRRITVRDALVRTNTILEADGQSASDYEVFTSWLLLAYTEGGRGHIHRSAPPSTPIYEGELIDRLEALVRQDLPDWKIATPPPAAPPTTATPVPPPAPAVATAEQKEKAPKLPSECWPEAIDILMAVMGVDDEEDLAEVHHRMANCAKASERRTVLKNMLRREAQRLGYDSVTATKELWESIAEFEYASSRGIDCLTHGVHPAMVAYTSDQAEIVKEERAKRALMRDGDLTATELDALQKSAKVALPQTETQLRRMLEAFKVLLNILHGEDDLTTYYQNKVIRNIHPILKALAAYSRDPKYKEQNVYAGYIRSLQRMFFQYYESMTFDNGTTRLPPFNALLESMQIQTWVPPSLPQDYLSTEVDPAKKGGGGGGKDPKNPGARVRNTSPHASLIALGKRMGQNITHFLIKLSPGNGARTQVPKLEDGTEHCLTWQCKGSCMKGCERAAGHRVLTNTELETLATFLEDGCNKIGS